MDLFMNGISTNVLSRRGIVEKPVSLVAFPGVVGYWR